LLVSLDALNVDVQRHSSSPQEAATMHPKTIDIFSETIAKTGHWIDEVMLATGHMEERHAYSALRAVLHVLRDRLTVDEAVNLGAELPMLVRGFYYEGWRPAGRPAKHRHKAEFLRLVSEAAPGLTDIEIERAVRGVFALLSRHVSAGEISQVRDQLPAEVREMWELAA
jgi:uncharacterized protein (DUF2267 family)